MAKFDTRISVEEVYDERRTMTPAERMTYDKVNQSIDFFGWFILLGMMLGGLFLTLASYNLFLYFTI